MIFINFMLILFNRDKNKQLDRIFAVKLTSNINQMNYTVVGLFPNQNLAKEVSENLEQSGFQNEDYIIYKSDKKTQGSEKRSLWKKILGLNESTEPQSPERLITSVSARNEEELETIRKSFEKNEVVKIYEFQDMTLEEAKNLDYIKKIVSLRAKSQIYAMPNISLKHGNLNEGISTEVKA